MPYTANTARPGTIIACALLCLMFAAVPVSAATLTVTSTADNGAGTLRNTIAAAGAGDTIRFSLAPYPATITLASTLTIAKNLTITGPSSQTVIVSGGGNVRVFDIAAGYSAAISNLTIANGYVGGQYQYGAGIRLSSGYSSPSTLTLDRCMIQNNALTANCMGAGLFVSQYGTCTVNRCTITGNTVGLQVSDGAGMASYGTLSIYNSTISGNSGRSGVGIYTVGGNLTMNNVTVSGNTCDQFGAVCLGSPGASTLTNCTITDNTSSNYTAGFVYGFGSFGTLQLANNIIAGNHPPASSWGDVNFSDTTSAHSLGYNLIGNPGNGDIFALASGDLVGTESIPLSANLAPLADNGGWVPTHALTSASTQAIDSGLAGGSLFWDARGFERNGHWDKGAYAYGGTQPVALAATNRTMTGFTAQWNTAVYASGYILDVATDSAFTNFVNGYESLNVGNVASYAVAGLSAETTYYYRVRMYNNPGQSWYSNTVTVTTLAPTATSTVSPTFTSTPTITLTATATGTVTTTPTNTPTTTNTPTASPTGTATPTSPASSTSTASPTFTAAR